MKFVVRDAKPHLVVEVCIAKRRGLARGLAIKLDDVHQGTLDFVHVNNGWEAVFTKEG